MKHKTLAVGLLLIVLIGSTFSCKKALENELSNDAYGDTFWKSQGDVEAATRGAYGLFRKSLNQNSCFFIWGDVPVGMFGSDQGTLATNLVTAGNFTVPYWTDGAHNWTNWYRVIDASNLIIENASKMPESLFTNGSKNGYLGEAYFLRAISYFYMTRVWGDLPLQLTATTSADQAKQLGRTDAATILKQVVADAQKASSLLTWESASTNEKRRASKGAALALLAHASEWGKDYEKTILYADSIASRKDLYNLQPKGALLDIFSNSSAPENIFVVTSKNSENEASAYTDYIFTANVAFLTVSRDMRGGMPYDPAYYYVPKDKIVTLYEGDPNDVRVSEFFYTSTQSGTAKEKLTLRKYANIAYKNAASIANPLAESNLVIFRLADILLLKAEALNALGRDGEAVTAANLVRNRAGAAPFLGESGILLTKKIMQERERELVGEGHNYFDIVRIAVNTKNPDFFLQIIPAWGVSAERFAQKGYLWPIANSILNANRLINQNTWWMGKL
nr:RagB/SusD family nutrient uptake outer membrane protein [Pedobacter panaciterrae]